MKKLNESGTLLLFTAQERDDHATEVENKLGHVSPGLLGSCEECQRNHGCYDSARKFYNDVHIEQTIEDEGSLSHYECELCGSKLYGDRFAAHAQKQTSPGKWDTTHLDVCSDCLMALANGIPYPTEI